MLNLPVIIAFGGVSAAGRSSFNQAFNWFTHDSLSNNELNKNIIELLALTNRIKFEGNGWMLNNNKFDEGSAKNYYQELLANSFIRKLNLKDEDLKYNIPLNAISDFKANSAVKIANHQYSEGIEQADANSFNLQAGAKILIPSIKKSAINTGAMVPTGFDPALLYNSVHHPRTLQLSVYAVSDCLNSLGIDWLSIKNLLTADKIGVYTSSMVGQVDEFGSGGYLKARLSGKRATGRNMPLSMPQMVADFINAYILDHIGHTHTTIGACATFLYNLQAAVADIQSGARKLCIVGAADAPLQIEVIESYAAMGALATDDALRELDGLSSDQEPNHRRACRPFGENKGFVLGESSQYFILCDATLAIELGATIYGAAAGVYVNADGYKGSISKPGPGNIFSLAQAVSLAKAILGEEDLKNKTYVSAHGTGTPQNRVSESDLISKIAKGFNIKNWPICAVKSKLGHSTGAAAGDQLTMCLGSFARGIIPSISTTTSIADDVIKDNLEFCLAHKEFKASGCFINAKGFGGNNATALILSPDRCHDILKDNFSAAEIKNYHKKNEQVMAQAAQSNDAFIKNQLPVIYNRAGEKQMSEKIEINSDRMIWDDYRVDLPNKNPYKK